MASNGLFGGLQNTLFGSNQTGNNAAALQSALGLMNAANVPQLGRVTYSKAGNAQAGNATADEYYNQAAKSGLEALQQEKGNLSQADLANLDATNRRINQTAGAAISNIRNQNAARGIGGSGVDMALQAAQGQQTANAASEAGANAMGNAQNRFVQARSQAADLGSQMQGQTFAQDLARRQAQDQRDVYNNDITNQAEYYNQAQRPMNQFGMQNQAYQGAAQGLGSQQQQGNYNSAQGQQFGNALIGAGGSVLGGYLGRPSYGQR